METLREHIEKDNVNESLLGIAAGIAAVVACIPIGIKVYNKLRSSGFSKQAKQFKEQYENYKERVEALLDKYPESLSKLAYLQNVKDQDYDNLCNYGFFDKLAMNIELLKWDRRDRREFKSLVDGIRSLYDNIFKFMSIELIEA